MEGRLAGLERPPLHIVMLQHDLPVPSVQEGLHKVLPWDQGAEVCVSLILK
jgi:hypothetical protein